MAFLCSNLPHVDVFVKKEYLYDLEKGHGELEPGLWISVKSIQGRALYFETYLPTMVLCMISYLYQHLFGKKITEKVCLCQSYNYGIVSVMIYQ